MASVPNDNSTDAWSQARDRFCNDLAPDEARIFATANLENVIDEAQKPLLDRRSGRISQGIQAICTGIAQYGDALDVFSGIAPLILGPLWGSLRLVILLASEYGKYFEKLLDMFSRINDVLPRFKVYEKLFPHNERLRENISKAYLELLRFTTSAKDAFRNKKPSAFYLKVAFKLTWKPFEKQFGSILDNFWRHQKTIDREAALSHMIEAETSKKLEEQSRSLAQARYRDEDRIKSLALLSKINYENHHRRQQGLRHRGTGRWLLDTAEFKSWILNAKPCSLSCYGIPGSGKTVLCSSLIDHARSFDTCPPVLYYYFDYTDERTLSTSAAVGSLIQQLLLRPGRYTDEIERHIKSLYNNGLRSPGNKELINLLLLAAKGSSSEPTYIFIDGLNEAEKGVQADLMLALDWILSSPEVLAKVFLSFREDSHILKQLKSSYEIKLSEAQLTGDIVCYVEDTVKAKINQGLLTVQDQNLEIEIVGELIRKACGMFLWVSLQLDEICDNTQSDSSIRETLRNLPETLHGTYERILRKISRSSSRHRTIAHRILMWVIYAKRPLSLPELKDAIFFEPDQESWDGSRIPGDNSNDDLVGTCKNLVTFDEISQTLRPSHHTVAQFFSAENGLSMNAKASNPSSSSSEPNMVEINFTKSANLWLGRCCIAYLSLSDFETQLVYRRPQMSLQPLEKFAHGLETLPGSLGIPNYISATYRTWSSSKMQNPSPSKNFANFVDPRPTQQVPVYDVLEAKHPLLRYIIENWTTHTLAFMEDTNIISENEWKLFFDLVHGKMLMFSFRPWQDLSHDVVTEPNPDLPFMALFNWSIENGLGPFLLFLKHPPEGKSLSGYVEYWFRRPRVLVHEAIQELWLSLLRPVLCNLLNVPESISSNSVMQFSRFKPAEVPRLKFIPPKNFYQIYVSQALFILNIYMDKTNHGSFWEGLSLLHNIIFSTDPLQEEVECFGNYWKLDHVHNLFVRCWNDKSPVLAGQRLPKAARIPIRKAIIATIHRNIKDVMRNPPNLNGVIQKFFTQQFLKTLEDELRTSFMDAGLELPKNWNE